MNSSVSFKINNTITEEISPRDPDYPMMLLSSGLKRNFDQAQKAAQEIYKVIEQESPMIAQLKQSTEKGFRFVVDATDETLEAIDSGAIKLLTDKNGNMHAQIMDANGHFGSKLPIKREDFEKGIDPVQMTTAMQVQALQNQIDAIAEQIDEINHSVKDILLGQQNDRIGLYYSGLALYLESQNIQNSEMKNAMIAQALRSLSDSTFQLTMNIQSDIQFLVNKEYESAKRKRIQVMDEKMANINRAFAFIHQATMLRAGIYCSLDELAAMSLVLDEYSIFIEDTIARNANILAQCDFLDNGTEEGVWKSRARIKLSTSEVVKQLTNTEKVVYLVATEGETE